jgi:hypothetical protein
MIHRSGSDFQPAQLAARRSARILVHPLHGRASNSGCQPLSWPPAHRDTTGRDAERSGRTSHRPCAGSLCPPLATILHSEPEISWCSQLDLLSAICALAVALELLTTHVHDTPPMISWQTLQIGPKMVVFRQIHDLPYKS